MTDERKNEIWAMLDAKSQKAMTRLWYNTPQMRDECKLLEILFGSHNLAAQAEDSCTNPTENGISDSKIQSESAESVETSTKEDAYFDYRLDLAKEIAIAIINTANKDAPYGDMLPYVAVKIAAEIVERLKETE